MSEALAHQTAISPTLTETEQRVLAFEKQWWTYPGAKETAIREMFGMNATRYYQLLNSLLDCPAALAEEPMLIKRLRRMRDSRHKERSARRLAQDLV